MLYVNAGLARRLEAVAAADSEECAESCGRLRAADAESMRVSSGIAAFAGADSPLTGGVGLGMRGPVMERDLDRFEEFFVRHGVGPQIRVNPFADPSLAESLGRREFHLEGFMNVIVRPIDVSDSSSAPDEIGVTVASPDQADAWSRAVEEAFDDQPETTQALAAVLFGRESSVEFIARIDGEVAAVASMSIHDGVASLSTAATLERFRCRGAHGALLHARLAYAASHGCDLAVGHVKPGTISQRNSENAGFRVIYTTVRLGKAVAS